jgi:CheY-like chemotaxis protein
MKLLFRDILVIDDQLGRDIDTPGQPSRKTFLRAIGESSIKFRFCTGRAGVDGDYSVELMLDFIRVERRNNAMVLLDVMFDGVDLARIALPKIRSQFPDLPVVIMTTEKPQDNGREYLRLGAVDYLIKPLEPRRFWRVAHRYAADDPSRWLLGQHDLYQGSVLAAASLAERNSHVLIQGGSGEERLSFAEYVTRVSGRTELVAIDVREIAEEAIIWQLFGRRVGIFDSDLAAGDEGLLSQSRGAVILLSGIEALPRGVQSLLGRYFATQATNESSIILVADSHGGLGRLAQEDRFDRDLFDLLNGSQAVNIPPAVVRIEDLPLRVGVYAHTLTRDGVAFDSLDEKALEDALRRIPVGKYQDWESSLLEDARRRTGGSFQQRVKETPIGDEMEKDDLVPFFPERSLEERSDSILVDIRLRELGLIASAFQAAGGNRARAAFLLKCANQGKASTVHFDRWFMQVWKTIPLSVQNQVRVTHPVLENICRALKI